ncbi:CZB domain-containing protein [Ottowia flava]|uniref:CZB domain-containing protein n=1 Tax=Ottowia flava TaxID=2675430 RepID=A0ABW4KUF1_9BURK|nr:CZB domain-containing protein [Ottowia sp. GY511]
MGILSWITGQSSHATSPTPPPQRARSAPPAETRPLPTVDTAKADHAAPAVDANGRSMVAGGLDFVSAIHAHQQWKTRLSIYVRNESSEKLDYRAICRDDQCVLGRWINGEAGVKFGHLPSFGELKVAHGMFHLAAGRVIQLHDEDKSSEAMQLLRQGEYPRHSIKVMGLLSALYTEVEQSGQAV